MGGGGGVEFLVVGNPEEVETRIKDAFDRLLQKLLEDAILIDAGFVQSLRAQKTKISLAYCSSELVTSSP